MSKQDNSEAMKYVRSLRDPLKRRFAATYLDWIRLGRIGSMPARGALSAVVAQTVSSNLDGLN